MKDDYYRQLCREYDFLAHKFSLTPIATSLWKFARMRPDNSPFVRMAQLAMLYYNDNISASTLIGLPDKENITSLLRVGTSPYWNTHFTFASTPTANRPKVLGEASLTLLLINAVLPFLFTYGRHIGDDAAQERAINMLEQLPAENNYIIRSWNDCGLTVNSAVDSQALIHLKHAYCERKDCLRCRIGYQYLKKS